VEGENTTQVGKTFLSAIETDEGRFTTEVGQAFFVAMELARSDVLMMVSRKKAKVTQGVTQSTGL
jgi:hypothetical protein